MPKALRKYLRLVPSPRPMQAWLVGMMTCAVISGCQSSPEPCRKSLTELYYEAVAASQNTPERNGAVATTTMCDPSQNFLPPAALGTPVELMAPEIPIPSPMPEEILPPLTGMDHDANPQQVPLLPINGNQHTTQNQGWRKSGAQSANSKRRVSRNAIQQVSHSTAGPLVSEFLEDSDVRQALQSIAQQANVNLIVDEQVGGIISATIEDEPFESALKKILMPMGLVFSKESESEYIVGVADPSSPLFSQLSERIDFRPLHLSPTELVGLVPERQRKFAQAIENRNRILIEAPPEIAQQILERLQRFDTPIPQVELEAIVCVISPDKGFQSGLDWGHAVTLNGSELLNLGMAGLAFTGAGSGAGISNSFSNFATTSAFVKLLAQEGYIAIRAAPRVTARDGDQAKIAITRESFFSTQPQSDNAFFRQDIESVQAGIELDITPIVRGDNITMKIEKAEVSEDIRTSQVNSGITENPYPQINRRTVSTTVHVKDGETIVIGGLVQRQTVNRIAKVPFLGDIPGVGRMFKTIDKTEQDVEVVIFISPKLVNKCP